jgi:glycosyltransferase involved in cell wall biosynthesis
MKVVHILNYSWENGGSSKVVFDLACAQVNAGMEVVIYSLQKADHKPFHTVKAAEHIQVNEGIWAKFMPMYSAELYSYLKTGHFDVVHLHGLWNFANLAVALLGLEKKCLLTVHGCLSPYTFKGKEFKRFIFSTFFQKKSVAKIKVLHALHAVEAEEIKNYGGKETAIRIIPNGISLPATVPDPKVRNRLQFLFMSRLHQKKGLDLLLPAFERVIEKFPEAELHLAGPDFGMLEFLNEYLNLYPKNIKYLGTLSGTEKINALNNAGFFALTSYSEGLSIAVLEALSYGLPVLVSGETGLSQEIENYEAGLITDLNEEAIYQHIIDLIKLSEVDYEALSKKAVILIKENFEEREIMQRLLDTYAVFKV